MRVLILEDELPASDRLTSLLQSIDTKIEILSVIDTISEAEEYLKSTTPQVIFSDIELADGLCFELFEKSKTKIPVIFTTAYNEYAIRAFEANAIDYLLKPIKKFALENALEKLRARVHFELPQMDYGRIASAIAEKTEPEPKRYLVKYGNKMVIQDPNEAAYFYSIHKASFLKATEGKAYPLDESLSQIESDLDSKRYFRINRNMILSLESIVEMKAAGKGRVEVFLDPPHTERNQNIVSVERSPYFKKWLKG